MALQEKLSSLMWPVHREIQLQFIIITLFMASLVGAFISSQPSHKKYVIITSSCIHYQYYNHTNQNKRENMGIQEVKKMFFERNVNVKKC